MINLTRDQYLELEKIALGAFSPLNGFMNESEFHSVVDTMRLPSSDVFSMPVVLDIEKSVYELVKDKSEIDLLYDGNVVGRIRPNDYFSCDRMSVAKKVYGTGDNAHPGVRHFYQLKDVFVGGDVALYKRPKFDVSSHEMTPKEMMKLFEQRAWTRVVGFQTRNVPHRAHEYLHRIALEVADGLLIQPLLGKKKKGDYTPEAVMKGYRALIDTCYPADRVVLAGLTTVMRYAGPREAIFHAIIRRNYGCTHFIVGRDHAGVSDWYGLYDAQTLTKQFDGDLGIEIMRLKGPYYCDICDGIATENTCSHYGSANVTEISGTYMREILGEGGVPDKHLMRPEVVNALNGIRVFID